MTSKRFDPIMAVSLPVYAVWVDRTEDENERKTGGVLKWSRGGRLEERVIDSEWRLKRENLIDYRKKGGKWEREREIKIKGRKEGGRKDMKKTKKKEVCRSETMVANSEGDRHWRGRTYHRGNRLNERREENERERKIGGGEEWGEIFIFKSWLRWE